MYRSCLPALHDDDSLFYSLYFRDYPTLAQLAGCTAADVGVVTDGGLHARQQRLWQPCCWHRHQVKPNSLPRS